MKLVHIALLIMALAIAACANDVPANAPTPQVPALAPLPHYHQGAGGDQGARLWRHRHIYSITALTPATRAIATKPVKNRIFNRQRLVIIQCRFTV